MVHCRLPDRLLPGNPGPTAFVGCICGLGVTPGGSIGWGASECEDSRGFRWCPARCSSRWRRGTAPADPPQTAMEHGESLGGLLHQPERGFNHCFKLGPEAAALTLVPAVGLSEVSRGFGAEADTHASVLLVQALPQFLPSDRRAGIRLVEAPVELSPVLLRKRERRLVGGDAIPDLLHQGKPLLDRELEDVFKRDVSHTRNLRLSCRACKDGCA
jgi:hypothetical protein